ncbi:MULTISPECIES: TetR/AcrR family transcriptional regulator [unclassified Streptomyces]|uniref:TetR/AcrR family transcriptional regulator n=1 Tax=unclassified Streptomyces TaxID=2593676 RepID=UPI00224CD502|nr:MULTISPECIES: TetR/AcrR family transcriptional regulator [unclassified Streptomyces]MCX4642023.1 TetR/AcrR family transcriptional regulator [Streptomyces sp. NBC_01446]MCX5085755.1 TetR/AcrR family transcriptional regulator [Streptomyces sp. NBC_00401]MCX5326896.1 TetR/AcrR family transcriptional regulator [Streptomyces sp. NBC_00120]
MTAVATKRRSRITPEREAELFAAVLDLLREVGYDALTVEAVAARTRSSKATLYRQWGGKAGLVVKAVRHNKPDRFSGIDTGTLRGDLHALVQLEDDCTIERNSALMRGVAMAMHNIADLRGEFRAQLVEPELSGFHQVIQRAIDRGEVRADCPALEGVLHMMIGGYVTPALLDDQPPTQASLAWYIDAVVLPALGLPTAS